MSKRKMGDFQEWFSTCQAAVITTECGSSDIIKLPLASVTYRWHLTVCQVTFDLFVQFVIMLSLFITYYTPYSKNDHKWRRNRHF